jgi:hypothetical protein
MPLHDIQDRDQLAVVTEALKEICLVTGIDGQSPDGDAAARLLMHLYKNGDRSTDKLRSALSPATLQALQCSPR